VHKVIVTLNCNNLVYVGISTIQDFTYKLSSSLVRPLQIEANFQVNVENWSAIFPGTIFNSGKSVYLLRESIS
jgi:hypothetical protein